MKLIEPQSPEDFERYFMLRYEVLRKPWNQPFDTVKDELEEVSMHAMIVNEKGEAIGVCRMHLNNSEEAQLRFMGIREDARGLSLGKQLLLHFECLARKMGVKRIILQSRENALGFYKNNGYVLMEKTYLMWNLIQHYRMQKDLV
ncbi:MAG TPA: GNAT family N-acetyltransferase [Bacteroidia bacterium]|jgi:N-acetylglutamate synthase-like GNAT family acetyltransferase|nr:GNAT family N-acetyltransferase [Bacteroidia bacterium]